MLASTECDESERGMTDTTGNAGSRAEFGGRNTPNIHNDDDAYCSKQQIVNKQVIMMAFQRFLL